MTTSTWPRTRTCCYVQYPAGVLEAGGDFADGVIAYDGAFLGAETFVSFDRKAVALLAGQGRATKLLT